LYVPSSGWIATNVLNTKNPFLAKDKKPLLPALTTYFLDFLLLRLNNPQQNTESSLGI